MNTAQSITLPSPTVHPGAMFSPGKQHAHTAFHVTKLCTVYSDTYLSTVSTEQMLLLSDSVNID